MCLITKTRTPKRAKKDIICYKVLRTYTYSDGTEEIDTPYQFATIPKDVINGEKPFIAKTDEGDTVTEKRFERCAGYYDSFSAVNGCAIHTFATKIDAQAEVGSLKTYFGAKCIIYKCIIPKDTLYYEGDFEGKKSFASHKIVFKKKV